MRKAWSPDAVISRTAIPGRSALVRSGGLVLSLLVHACGFALFSHASLAARAAPAPVLEARSDSAPIYLDLRALKELRILRALPVIRPAGTGGKPGTSASPRPRTRTADDVPQASTVQNPKFTIVVNPLKPENRKQAIRQSMAPPDLKIKVEQLVPDILMADEPAPAAPTPQVDFQMHQPTASQPVLDARAIAAPSVAPTAPAPQLPMNITPAVNQPKMPASYFTSDSLRAPHPSEAAVAASRKKGNVDPSAEVPGGLAVLSAQPAPFSQLTTLAQGNRYGALAIAPSKPGDGSPGGKPYAPPTPGPNGAAGGGDASAGVGPGTSGGGGGAQLSANASLGAVDGSGKTGGVDANGLLGPVLPAAVFPVTIAAKLRHAPLVISAGPIGGGGLDVYDALTCGKVYSIFLPMPGKNWALEYCAHEASAPVAKPAPQPSAGVVHMEAGIVPPSSEQQFDFRRLPVPDKDGDKLIVLQGIIGADGGVSNVRVFRGVLSEMDAEAAQAFANWKFKPATRAGAPIALDVLVGVPARAPENARGASPDLSIAR